MSSLSSSARPSMCDTEYLPTKRAGFPVIYPCHVSESPLFFKPILTGCLRTNGWADSTSSCLLAIPLYRSDCAEKWLEN